MVQAKPDSKISKWIRTYFNFLDGTFSTGVFLIFLSMIIAEGTGFLNFIIAEVSNSYAKVRE